MEKLPKRIKDEWVKALLSGKYKQGDGHLNRNGKMCCMGVLADICGVNWDNNNGNQGFLTTLPLEEQKKLPKQLLVDTGGYDIDLGLKQALPYKLAYMNDKRNRSFKYIASYIKRYL